MRFTRRSLEGALALACAVVAITSCATVTRSSEEPPPGGSGDGGPIDAGDAANSGDASPPGVVAGPRRKVVCAGAPCAIDLVSVTSRYEAASEESPPGTFCVLLADGHVACWGSNAHGELGRSGGPSGRPAFVEGVSGATMLDGRCAVVGDGAVMCWGEGVFMQEAGTSPTERAVRLPIAPARRVRTMSRYADDEVGCAELSSGEVTCWGLGPEGVVEDGSNGWVGTVEPAIVALPEDSPFVEIAAGVARFALRADGVALSWGSRRSLGRASSLSIDRFPTPVALSGVTDLDAVAARVCAVAKGNVYCWGDAFDVEVPVPTQPLPEIVANLPDDMVQVSTTIGREGVWCQRACAVSSRGDVYCWGENRFGQAGDGTRAFAFSPVKVVGLPEPAVSVRTAQSTTCALLESGRVHCWGDDSRGALGRGDFGSFDEHPAPVVLP